MERVLLTGMSGTGKSTVTSRLAALGHKVVDLDDEWCDQQADGRRLWRADKLLDLLAHEDAEVLFVAGCEANTSDFVPRFDVVILLTAPVATLLERIEQRTDNPFGTSPEERARLLQDVREVEPRLRRVAHHEVETTAPVDDVLRTVLALATSF